MLSNPIIYKMYYIYILSFILTIWWLILRKNVEQIWWKYYDIITISLRYFEKVIFKRPPKPEPDGHFLFGNWPEFIHSNIFDFFNNNWKLYDQGHGIYRVWMGPKPLYVVSNKKYIDEILRDKNRNHCTYDFIRGDGFDVIRRIFGNDNIGTLEDNAYKEKRQFIHQHFTPKLIEKYSAYFYNNAWKKIKDLMNNNCTELNMTLFVQTLSCDVTGAIFVNQNESSEKIEKAAQHLGKLITIINRTAFTPYPVWFIKYYEIISGWLPSNIIFMPEHLQPHVWQTQKNIEKNIMKS